MGCSYRSEYIQWVGTLIKMTRIAPPLGFLQRLTDRENVNNRNSQHDENPVTPRIEEDEITDLFLTRPKSRRPHSAPPMQAKQTNKNKNQDNKTTAQSPRDPERKPIAATKQADAQSPRDPGRKPIAATKQTDAQSPYAQSQYWRHTGYQPPPGYSRKSFDNRPFQRPLRRTGFRQNLRTLSARICPYCLKEIMITDGPVESTGFIYTQGIHSNAMYDRAII
jgi:hypothetical protein